MSDSGKASRYAPGWRHRFHVGSYEVDPSGGARLASLFNYLQEAAGGHAEHLDLGYHALRSQANLGFVLSRVAVEVNRLPRWDDSVLVVTWPKRAEKLLALRDFVVLPDDGSVEDSYGPVDQETLERYAAGDTPLVRATTAWLLIDTDRMRPVRPERNLAHVPINPGLDSIAQVPERILVPDKPATSEQTRITRYSDIDQNDHVNNARYVEWLTDFLAASAMPTAEHSLPAPRDLLINFTGEVKLGDQVEIRGREDSDGVVTVWLTRDRETSAVARFRF